MSEPTNISKASMTNESFEKLFRWSAPELVKVKERLTDCLLKVDPDDKEAKSNFNDIIIVIEVREKLFGKY